MGFLRRIKKLRSAHAAKAGIDPLNKLIDRKPDDNTVKVEKEAKERAQPGLRPAATRSVDP